MAQARTETPNKNPWKSKPTFRKDVAYRQTYQTDHTNTTHMEEHYQHFIEEEETFKIIPPVTSWVTIFPMPTIAEPYRGSNGKDRWEKGSNCNYRAFFVRLFSFSQFKRQELEKAQEEEGCKMSK